MATVSVGDVLTSVRDEHPAFGPNAEGRGPLLRYLIRYQKRLLAQIAQWKRDAVHSEYTISMPLATFSDGDSGVPAHIHVHGGKVVFDNADYDDEPLELVGYRHRLEGDRFRWGAYLRENTLFLLGDEKDWDDIASIVLDYFPEGGTLTSEASNFELPGDPLDVLVAAAAKFLARRSPNVDRAARMELFEEHRDAEGAYLDQVTGRGHASTGPGSDSW